MDQSALIKTHPQQLESLLAVDGQTARWIAQDLADVLHHQLSAPLLADLRRVRTMPRQDLGEWVGRLGAAEPSFADLLAAPSPPPELLQLLKEFGKSGDKDPDQPLPTQVATLLYYAAITTALVRHGTRISRLGDGDLREGVGWALALPWLDARLRPLFEAGRELLDPVRIPDAKPRVNPAPDPAG